MLKRLTMWLENRWTANLILAGASIGLLALTLLATS
jgi:hypothetical protein